MRVERTYPVASATYRLSGISTYPAKIVPFAVAFRNSRLGGLAHDERNVMIFRAVDRCHLTCLCFVVKREPEALGSRRTGVLKPAVSGLLESSLMARDL